MPDFEVRAAPPGQQICDFCSSPDVHWVYPARGFGMKAPPNPWGVNHANSPGGWAACNACKALIDRGLRDKLTRRCAKRILRKYNLDVPEAVLIRKMRPLHDNFWANREGPAQPA